MATNPVPLNTGLTDEQITTAFDNALTQFPEHQNDTDIHTTADDKSRWDGASNQAAINRSTLGFQRKNLLPNRGTTKTTNGVTFTVNDDKSITINGTATASADFNVAGWYGSTTAVVSAIGKHVVSMGNISGSGIDVYFLNVSTTLTKLSTDTGYVNVTDTTPITGVLIRIPANTTIDNLTVYPMLRYAEITDNTYEPYVDDVNVRLLSLETDVQSSATWNLISTDYTTVADYAAALPAGRHTAFWRSAYDTHITDMPSGAGNLFLDIYKYSNSTIRINAFMSLQTNVVFYSRALSSGTWGSWYKFSGEAV